MSKSVLARRGARASLSCKLTALLSASAIALAATPAFAQLSSNWTTSVGGDPTDYNNPLNWDTTTPPVNSGYSASFNSSGSGTIVVTRGTAIAPYSWTFNSGAQAYIITGADVNFSGDGLIDNATNAVSIANNIGGSGGLTVGTNASLTLSGNNTFTGATNIDTGTLIAGSTTAFSQSSAMTLNGNLDLNGFNNTIGNLSGVLGAGNITNGSTGTADTLTVNMTSATTYGGNISDGGNAGATTALALTGTGTLTLDGVNSYTGGTNIGSGTTLQLGDGTNPGTAGTGAITNNGTLVVDSTITVASNISGAGAVTVDAGQTVTLSGTNTYTGLTTVNGTLKAGSTTAFTNNTGNANFPATPGAAFNIASTGTLDLNGYNNTIGGLTGSAGAIVTNNGGTPATLTVEGGGLAYTYSGNIVDGASTIGLTHTGGGNLYLAGNNTYSGGTNIFGTINAGSTTGLSPNSAFNVNSFSNLNINGFNSTIAGLTGSGNVVNGGVSNATLTVNVASGTDTFSGALENSGHAFALTKTGAGTLTLNDSPGGVSYSGDTNIMGGTLQAGGVNSLTPNSDYILAGGATLDLNGNSNTLGGLNGTGTVTNTAAATTATLTVNNGGTFNGNLSDGAGTLGLTVTGPGSTLTLTGIDNYSGATTVTSGSLVLGSPTALPNSSNLVVNGTLDLGGFGASTPSLAGSGTITNNGGSPATLTVSGLAATTFSGVIQDGSGTTALNITGSGLNLTGTNTYSGGTTIGSSHQLTIGGGAATGTVGSGPVTDNGDLALGRTGTYTIANTITGSGSVSQFNAGTAILTSSSNAYGVTNIDGGTLQIGDGGADGSLGSGTVTLVAGTTLAIDQSGTYNLTDTISGASGNLVQKGGGTTIISGTNTIGSVVISAGTLEVESAGAIGSASVNTTGGTLKFNDGVTNTTYSNTITGSGTIAIVTSSGGIGLNGNGTGFTGTVIIDGTSQLGITPTAVGNAAITDSGSLGLAAGTYSNAISGPGGVGTGAGAVVLTGANSYGNTLVSPGSNLTIGANGTSGTLGTGTVTLSGGTSLTFSRSDTVTVANTITGGGGSVIQNGDGTTILTGTDNWSGGTTISDGTLQIGNGGSTGSVGSGPVTDNAALAIDHNNGTNISTAISGSGTLTQMGSGTLTITVAQTYTGATIINSGTTLALSGAGDLSQSAGVADNGTFDISAITAASESLYRLQGSGTVVLGSKSLNITGPSGAFTGNFTGSGALNITGTETLSGNNSAYSGAVTISNGATVTLGGASSPLGTGSVTNNGTLTFAVGALTDIIFANPVSGPGAVNINNGIVLLTGANSYAGTTTVASGAQLDVGNNGTSGTLGTGAVVDNGFVVFNRTDTNTIANAISGSGGLTAGNGGGGNSVTILTGANTYSGLTTVNTTATLQIGNGGTAGALGTGAVTDNGTLAFDLSGSTTAANAISGTGGVTVLAGTVILTGANSYSGTTGIASGTTLTLSGSGTLGTGAVTDNGTLSFNDTGSVTVAAAIGGTGAVSASGGTTTLTGANSYSGTTTIASGATLTLGGSGTLGSGAVTDNGALSFNDTGTVTVAAAIGGTGAVTASGGTTTLTGANSYSGTTTIASGATLQIGAGGTTGTLGSGAVTDNGTLAYNRTDSVTLSTVISGTGGLTQSGSGTLILDGVNTYTGTTTVSAGILEVGDASTPGAKIGAVNVSSGATLSGHGTTGTVTVASGGKVQPGGTIGTLTVNGNFSLPAGSTLVAEVSPTVGDKVAVSGTATLGGALQIVPDAGTYTSGTDYKLISATSVSGTFSSTSGSVSGFTNTVQYSATGVDLILSTPGSATTTPATPPITTYLFGSYGQTPNQIAAGNALAAGVPTGALYVSTGTVVARGASAVPEVLTELSGDIHSSIRSAAIEDSRVIRDAVLNELGTNAPRGSDGIAVWGTIFGGYGSIAGGNATGLHHDSAGSIAGADIAASDNLRIGIAGAYSDNNASTTGKLSTAKGKMGNVIGYAGYQEGVIDLKFGAAYSFGTMHILRNVASTALVEYDSQSQHGSQIFGTAGYMISSDLAMVEPYLGVANISATSGAFSETGNVAALSGASKTNDLTYGTVGMKARLGDETLGGMPITPRIDLGWQHAFNHLTPGQTVTFLNAGTSFTTLGVPLGTDAAAVQLGFDLAVAPDVILSAGYDGSFSSTNNNNAIEARINLAL